MKKKQMIAVLDSAERQLSQAEDIIEGVRHQLERALGIRSDEEVPCREFEDEYRDEITVVLNNTRRAHLYTSDRHGT